MISAQGDFKFLHLNMYINVHKTCFVLAKEGITTCLCHFMNMYVQHELPAREKEVGNAGLSFLGCLSKSGKFPDNFILVAI